LNVHRESGSLEIAHAAAIDHLLLSSRGLNSVVDIPFLFGSNSLHTSKTASVAGYVSIDFAADTLAEYASGDAGLSKLDGDTVDERADFSLIGAAQYKIALGNIVPKSRRLKHVLTAGYNRGIRIPIENPVTLNLYLRLVEVASPSGVLYEVNRLQRFRIVESPVSNAIHG